MDTRNNNERILSQGERKRFSPRRSALVLGPPKPLPIAVLPMVEFPQIPQAPLFPRPCVVGCDAPPSRVFGELPKSSNRAGLT